MANTSLYLTTKRIKEAITSEKPLWIEDQNALKQLDNEGNFVVMCKGRGDEDRLYFITGKLENRGGAKIMVEPKYLGMASKKVNDLGNIDTSLPSSVENALKDYLTTIKIDDDLEHMFVFELDSTSSRKAVKPFINNVFNKE